MGNYGIAHIGALQSMDCAGGEGRSEVIVWARASWRRERRTGARLQQRSGGEVAESRISARSSYKSATMRVFNFHESI